MRCSAGDRIEFGTDGERGGGVISFVVGRVIIVTWDAGGQTILTMAVLEVAVEGMQALDAATAS